MEETCIRVGGDRGTYRIRPESWPSLNNDTNNVGFLPNVCVVNSTRHQHQHQVDSDHHRHAASSPLNVIMFDTNHCIVATRARCAVLPTHLIHAIRATSPYKADRPVGYATLGCASEMHGGVSMRRSRPGTASIEHIEEECHHHYDSIREEMHS